MNDCEGRQRLKEVTYTSPSSKRTDEFLGNRLYIAYYSRLSDGPGPLEKQRGERGAWYANDRVRVDNSCSQEAIGQDLSQTDVEKA